jgi:hypothetical protein
MTSSLSKEELINLAQNLNPFGDLKTTISIGDFSFTFCNLKKEQKDFLEESYRGFILEEKESCIKVETGKLEKEIEREKSDFDLLHYDEKSFLTSHYFIASREDNEKKCKLQFVENNEKYLLFAVENFLRWMISELAIKRHGLLLHASSKVLDGNAHIFLGNHEAGKSTAVSLIDEGFTIADDVVLVMFKENCHYAYTMPSVTKFVQNEKEIGKYKVKAFYKLVKSNENKLKKLTKPLAFAVVVSSVPFLVSTNRHHYIAKNLIERVPVYELHFKKEKGFFKEALKNL